MYCGARLTADELLDKPAGSGSIAPEDALRQLDAAKKQLPGCVRSFRGYQKKITKGEFEAAFSDVYAMTEPVFRMLDEAVCAMPDETDARLLESANAFLDALELDWAANRNRNGARDDDKMVIAIFPGACHPEAGASDKRSVLQNLAGRVGAPVPQNAVLPGRLRSDLHRLPQKALRSVLYHNRRLRGAGETGRLRGTHRLPRLPRRVFKVLPGRRSADSRVL